MSIYPTLETSWLIMLIGSFALGALISSIPWMALGIRLAKKREPELWQQLRHWKAQAERATGKALHYKSVLKSVQLAMAVPELLEED